MRKQEPLRPLKIHDFAGVCQTNVTDRIPKNMLADGLNIQITPAGELAIRFGFTLYASTKAPDGKEVRTAEGVNLDGTLRILVATDTHIYDYAPATGTWSLVDTIATTTGAMRVTFAVLNQNAGPLVVYGNGKTTPRKMTFSTGTGLWTVADCGGTPPKGRPVAFKNYIVMFNIDTHPGRVQFSFYNGDPDQWTVLGVKKYVEMVGTVTSCFPYAGGLVIASDFRTEKFNGDPDNIQPMEVLSTTVGIASHETVSNCNGKMWWLSKAGVMEWDGAGKFPARNMSDPKENDKSSIRKDMGLIDWDKASSFCGTYHPPTDTYYLSAKISLTAAGTPLSRTWAYNFEAEGWCPTDVEATAFSSTIDPVTKEQILLSGTAAGELRILDDRSAADETVAGGLANINYWGRSADLDLDMSDWMKLFRFITVSTSGQLGRIPAGVRNLKVWLRGDFEQVTTGQITLDTGQGGFILDFNVLGDTLGATNRFVESVASCSIRAKHINIFIEGTGATNAVPISEIMIEWRPYGKRRRLLTARSS